MQALALASPATQHPYKQHAGRMQHVQQLQQRRRQEQQQPAAAQQQSSGEETDLLWAGYSALTEQLQRAHRRHETLATQLQDVQAKLHAVQHQQQQQQPSAATAWQAASFLLFFLCFINGWALIANLQMGWQVPWAAAKASASHLALKQLLGVAVPFTNTAVVMIFCLQAVRAAWTCLRW